MLTNEVRMEVLPYMTASYIVNIFHNLEEKPVSVGIKRNKYGICDGAVAYFPNGDIARQVVMRLNGRFLPDTRHPPFRFNLVQGLKVPNPDYTLWVGDLSEDVDEYQMFKFFNSHYNSVFYAKVIKNNYMPNKQYGFVKFTKEDQQKHCLKHMDYAVGLGIKKIRVSSLKLSMNISNSEEVHSNTSSGMQYSQSRTYPHSNQLQRSAASANVTRSRESKEKTVTPMSAKKELKNLQEKYYELNDINLIEEDELYIPLRQVSIDNMFICSDRTKLIDYNTDENQNESDYTIIEEDFNMYDKAECTQWLPVPILSPNICLYDLKT